MDVIKYTNVSFVWPKFLVKHFHQQQWLKIQFHKQQLMWCVIDENFSWHTFGSNLHACFNTEFKALKFLNNFFSRYPYLPWVHSVLKRCAVYATCVSRATRGTIKSPIKFMNLKRQRYINFISSLDTVLRVAALCLGILSGSNKTQPYKVAISFK